MMSVLVPVASSDNNYNEKKKRQCTEDEIVAFENCDNENEGYDNIHNNDSNTPLVSTMEDDNNKNSTIARTSTIHHDFDKNDKKNLYQDDATTNAHNDTDYDSEKELGGC